MAKLGRVFDVANLPQSPFTQQRTGPVTSPEEQLRDAMRGAGLEHVPDAIHIDGKLHRFCTSGKRGDSGWYIVFPDGVPAGQFGDWRTGVVSNFRADIGRKLSPLEELAHSRRMAEAAALREAEQKMRREMAAGVAATIWSEAPAASPEHPYLTAKGIQTHGARVTGDGRLIVPLYSPDGELVSLQYIQATDSGSVKRYHTGGQTGGAYWWLGALEEAGTVYVAEGFATAATIHQETGQPCIIAYSASNLVPVCGMLREQLGRDQTIVVVADHDEGGIGQKYADQAAAKYAVRVVIPPIVGMDANDYARAGNNLAALLMPPQVDGWLIPADEFSAQPAPISWLVKRWIQDQALIMVHGPSGGGKTFVVLDWCLRMASGTPDWCGQKVKAGNVIYLAGEGHHGLRSRVAAWKHQHQAGSLSMWLSKDGCDLNTSAGYVQVVEQIRKLDKYPSVIVVDTLHRFLSGDENSAQDAKTMLDACNHLMSEFSCSVILVHHTGVSEEAQHRARGSSAWRGALDIEISIVPAKDDKPMEIIQRKSKDAELAQPIYVNIEQVEIPGWFDEDGLPVTSAVIVQSEQTHQDNSTITQMSKQQKTNLSIFESSWWHHKTQEHNGYPYVSYKDMLLYLQTHRGHKEESAKQILKPSAKGKFISELLASGLVEEAADGWILADSTLASIWMMRKNDAA